MAEQPIAASDQRAMPITTAKALRWMLAASSILLALRIVSLWFNNSDLFFDEAQYWVWGKEPAFGYFSKPPLLAWLIAGVTSVCGDSEFCVRLASPIVHTATAFVLFFTANRMFSPATAFLTGITWLTLPAVSLSSTLISTDVPLLFFWSVTLYAFVRFESEGGWLWAALIALAFGLGLNAKYAMAYFMLCAVIYCMVTPKRPHLLTNARFWTAFALGFAFLLPNVLWNLQNEFVTVSHTGDNIDWGAGAPHFDRLGEFFGSQFGVFGPILFVIYLIAVVRLFLEGASPQQRLLISFSLPVLLLISFQAVMSKAFANWAATAFPAATILVSELMISRVPAIWSKLSLGLHGLVFAVLAVAVAFAAPGQLPLAPAQNPFNRMWGGSEIGEAMRRELAKGDYDYVLSDGRKRTSTLIYYLREREERVITLRGDGPPSDHFELTRAFEDLPEDVQSSAVFLFPGKSRGLPRRLENAFTQKTAVGEIETWSGSGETIMLYRLSGYSR